MKSPVFSEVCTRQLQHLLKWYLLPGVILQWVNDMFSEVIACRVRPAFSVCLVALKQHESGNEKSPKDINLEQTSAKLSG